MRPESDGFSGVVKATTYGCQHYGKLVGVAKYTSVGL
jgi:hypothetical protein